MRPKIGISCLLLLSLLFFLSTDVWADPVAKIVLTADPISIPADGEHSVAITATLTDRNGVLPDATTVTFTTDRGVFKNGLQTYSELNAGGMTGIVVVSLMSFLGDSGIAQVTCTADGVIQYIAVIFESAATIKLTANPTWIPADGSSSTSITAVLTGSNLSPVPAGTEVTFTTDKGKFQNGLQTITQITLTSTSSVVVSLIADTTTGLATVTCSTSQAFQNVTVAMGDLSVASITLAADPLFIPADGVSSSLITATLKDSKGSPAAVGTSATFTTTHGTFSNTLQTISVSTSDSSGIIKVSLIAATTNDIADIVCTSSGISQNISIGIGSSIGGITLSATPGKIPADGISSSAIGARIVDTNNELIGAGIPVTFETTLGTFSNGSKKIEVITTIAYLIAETNVAVSLIAGTASGTALVSCKSGNVTQAINVEIGDKPAATIKLTADPEQIPADGKSSSIITATVTDNGGNPIANGAAISFSTTLGKFSNGLTTITEIVSNGAGSVNVSLMSGTVSGIATVVCSSSGVTQAISVEIGNTLTPQVAGITLAANPTKIPADGLSSSLIKAVLVDNGGSPALNGTSVTFTTTLGVFSNNTTTISVTVSNGQGSVSTSLKSGTVSGVATVVCSSCGVSQAVTVQFGDGPRDPVAGIVLTANPDQIPANGNSSSLITANLTSASGAPVVKGTEVSFSTTNGAFDGSAGYTTVTIDDTGIVKVSLIAGTKSGIATVVCSSGQASQSIRVQIGDAPLAGITLSANPTKIPSDGNSSSLITAKLIDNGGNPALDGMSVKFSTSLGDFINSANQKVKEVEATITNGQGTVSVSLIAGTTAGVATVIAWSGGVSQSITIQIGDATAEPLAGITLGANPSSIPADGSSSALVTATLTDNSGNPVLNGISVTFKTTLGIFSNNTQTITATVNNGKGTVSVSLLSEKDKSGNATISCSSGGVSQSVTIQIGDGATQPVAGITLTANPEQIPADGKSSSLITAVLVDIGGNPVPNGISVTFSTTLGVFSNKTNTISYSVTNGQGSVSVSLISGTVSGNATIVCSSTGVSQAIIIQIGDGTIEPVAGIVLTASPEELVADGYSSSVITAILENAGGLPVAKGTGVTFTTTMGTFSNQSKSISAATIDNSGIVKVSLISGTISGTAIVVCSSGGVSQSIKIQIGDAPAKPVAIISLTVAPNTIPADGYSSAVVTATLRDSGGNPAGDGTEVLFTTTLGHFNNNSTSITMKITGGNGTVSVSLIAGQTSGIARIICSSNGVSQVSAIQIGDLPAAAIYLTADPTTLFADGYSMTLITAYLIDSQGQPVAKGASVTFTATKGLARFSNGMNAITISTPDDSGQVSVSLIAGTLSGLETVICSSSGVTQSVIIKIVKMQYETEPNNEMPEADGIIFGDAYHAQLASPYDTDWYVYTSTQSGVIGINFITTAIPEGAGCDGTTTVGTYRIDVRDTQNNVLMSYQNIDCTFDNGIWETGVQGPGTYYIVVYCPRLPDNGHYLSSPYYISAYKTLIPQCKPDIKANGLDGAITVTSATPVSITVSMEAGEQNELLADWWVIYSSPYGYYSLTFYGWLPGIYSLAQYPIFSLPSTSILYQYLSPGSHVFYFGVDITPNGIPDSPIFYDSVQVYVSP